MSVRGCVRQCVANEDTISFEHVFARALFGAVLRMMGQDRQLWAGMLAHLKTQHPALCRQWFEEIELVGVDAGLVRLRALTTIHRDYLQRQCLDAFNDAARTVSKLLITVAFFGPDDVIPRSTRRTDGHSAEIKPSVLDGASPTSNGVHPLTERGARAVTHAGADAGRPASAPAPMWSLTSSPSRPDTDSLVINPDYSFDHFVVGPSNRLAHAAAVAVGNSPGRAYNPFFVHGGVGLGKTHLLQAICLKIKEFQPETRIYYTSCEGFMTQFMDAVQAGEMSAFRHRFRDVDLLVIDDIHFLAKRERTQEEFFHTFNSLYQSHKQIILSSDAAPEEIPDLEDRLISRFKWGLVTKVEPPCYETRVAILKNKARIRGIVLADDVACYVAGKIDSNIRELEGVITKLQVLSSVEQRPVDMALATSALGEPPPRTDKQVQIQTIIAAVTDFYGVKITDLQSKRRQRSIALPRQVCMYLARRFTRFSLEEIGGYFGGRDHTTVMHAVRTVEERRELDNDFAQVVVSLESQIKTEPA